MIFQKLKLPIIWLVSLGLMATLAYGYRQSQDAAAPDDPAATTQADPIRQYLSQLTTRQKVAALLMLHVSGTDSQQVAEFVHTYQPGGIILMSDNITTDLSQVKALVTAIQSSAKPYPLFIAIDEEGCTVKRLPQDTFECAGDLGSKPTAATRQAFKQRSLLLKHARINMNFGIVADVTTDDNSYIYPRVFGGDPNQVGTYVAAAVTASQPTVLAAIKHFPGHGQTTADSHLSIPRVDMTKQDWLSEAAPPFQAGIKAGVNAVMFSHIAYTQIDDQPASLSGKWHQMLRQELAFTGLMVTDDLIMLQQSGEAAYQDVATNVIAAINAGNHINLLVNDHSINEQPHTRIDIEALLTRLTEALADGRIDEAALNSQLYKTMSVRAELP